MVGIDVVYNLGIIGYGSMANSHREILENSNLRIKLKAIYDINEERMYLAQKQGYKTYSSKEELLSDKDIDRIKKDRQPSKTDCLSFFCCLPIT